MSYSSVCKKKLPAELKSSEHSLHNNCITRLQGKWYVPFVASSLADADFVRSDGEFSFPYGFKHGTILPITPEEYERMKAHDWSDVPDNR